MPKEAIGYLTNDGRFFEVEEEAEEYEAHIALKAVLEDVGTLEHVQFMNTLAAAQDEVLRYINANRAASQYRSKICVSEGVKDDAGTEEDNEALLEFAIDGDEPLPNVGSSKQQKEIQHERKVNGIGGGGVDASNVRSSKDMATPTCAGLEKTCTSDGT